MAQAQDPPDTPVLCSSKGSYRPPDTPRRMWAALGC